MNQTINLELLKILLIICQKNLSYPNSSIPEIFQWFCHSITLKKFKENKQISVEI